MNRKHLAAVTGILLCALQLCSGEIQLIATCDIHGNHKNFARLATAINNYPEAVKIDIGDLFHGNALEDVSSGTPMIAALNTLKYDILIPGNHEFELPREKFIETYRQFGGSILGQFKIEGLKVAQWRLIERNGFRCAIIGMSDNGIYRDRRFYPHIRIIDEITALDNALSEIRKVKTDAVVLIRHGGDYFSGVPAGRILYRRPEIDLVICGHTHKEIAGLRRGRILFVQPGAFAESAVLVTIQKKSGKTLFIRSRLLRPERVQDKQIRAIFNQAQKHYSAALDRNAVKISGDFADRSLAALKKFSGADCAVLDLPELPQKMLSYRDFLNLFPYRNQLLTIECTLKEYQDFCRERVPARRKRFASAAPEGKVNLILVLNTFQLSRSKVFKANHRFRLLSGIERDIIQKEFDDAKTLHCR